jgi:uncharacterized delta-60 repeat protein
MATSPSILAAGDLDLTFGINGTVTTDFNISADEAHSVFVQTDGKIIVAGSVNDPTTGTVDFGLSRYNSDGSLDTTFGVGGKVTTDFNAPFDNGYSVIQQSDGKIVVVGSSYNDLTNDVDFALSRYNSDGSLDATFGTSGKVTTDFNTLYDYGHSIMQQSDGKIVAAGFSYDEVASSIIVALSRYNSDGSLDKTFGAGGKVTTNFSGISVAGFSVTQQSDGKIVVAGSSYDPLTNSYDFALSRYNSNGSLDTTFGTNGIVTTDFNTSDDNGFSVIQQNDGRIVTAGYSYNPFTDSIDFALSRYNSDGSLDTTFGTAGKVTTDFNHTEDFCFGVKQQRDGKLVIAGSSKDFFTGNRDFLVIRYNNDGSLDTTFGVGGKVSTDFNSLNDFGYSLAIQPDGNIIVVGSSDNDFAIARYYGGNVSPTNINLSTSSVAENSNNGIVVGSLSTTDPNSNDIHTYTLISSANGRFVLNGDQVVVADGSLLDYETTTSHTIRVRTTDSNGLSYEQDLIIAVSNVNEAVILSGTVATLSPGLEDTPYTINASTLLQGFTDIDGDTLSVSGLTATNGTLVNNNNGTYSFNPVANYNGTVNLSYTVIDGNGASLAATQTFNLVAVNDAPTLSNLSKTGNVNTVISFSASDFTSVFSDIDGDSLIKIQITSLPPNGTLKLNGSAVGINQEITTANLGNLTFTSNANYSGALSFTWNGFDGTTYAVTAGSVNVTVIGINVIGTPNADTLVGNSLANIIDGKASNDTLTGGGNKDTFIVRLGDGTDTITDFGGVGPGTYSNTNPAAAIRAEVDTLQFQGIGLNANNLLLTQNGNNLEVSFEGISGTKVILQSFALENLDNHATTGTNLAIGNILFDGQLSITDSFNVIDANSSQSSLPKRNSVTFFNDRSSSINGFDNSDDVINAQGGDDIVDGKGGNDLLRGGTGNDKLFGGAGNDILRGGFGNDTLSGGNDNDLFVLASSEGTDTITDFNLSADKIGLSGGLSFGQLSITQGTGSNARNTLITDGNNNQLLAILSGVQANTLTNGMFVPV